MISYNKNCKKNHHMGQEAGEKKKRKKKESRWDLHPCERGKVSSPWEHPSVAGRIAMTEREFQRL